MESIIGSKEQYEKALADIEKLQKEVKSLTKQVSNIDSRVQDVENLGLQQQIFDLSDRIKSFSQEFSNKIQDYEHELLGLQCYVSAVHVNEDVDVFAAFIFDSKLPNKQEVQTQLVADAARAKTEIFTSKRPNTIALDFHEKWADYLRSIGITFVTF